MKNYSSDTLSNRLVNTINFILKELKALKTNQIGAQGYITFPSLSADPAGAPDGTIYYNTTTPALRKKVNGTWSNV